MPPQFQCNHFLILLFLAGVCRLLFGSCGLAAEFPPPPAVPELQPELVQDALLKLNSPSYQERETGSRLLHQGDRQTAAAIEEAYANSEAEAKLRLIQALQTIYLRTLKMQDDQQARELERIFNQLQAAHPELLTREVDQFQIIHRSVWLRHAIRALLQRNAVLEFSETNYVLPGITKMNFEIELPKHIFIGEDWTGEVADLKYIDVLLRLTESSFGNQRAIFLIQGCPLPLKDVQNLVAGLPGVNVDQRSRARLGIAVTNPSPFVEFSDWKISEINQGSSAAHAGLQVHDSIVRLNGKILNTFDELTKGLEVYQPRDQVELAVLRETAEKKMLQTKVPASLAEFGLKIDTDFGRYTIIKEVVKDSPAAQLGLNTNMCIDRVNGFPVGPPDHFQLIYTQLNPGEPLQLMVRDFEMVPVVLRGWVGPYR